MDVLFLFEKLVFEFTLGFEELVPINFSILLAIDVFGVFFLPEFEYSHLACEFFGIVYFF